MVVNKARKKSRLLLSFKAAGCIEDSQPATIVLSEVKSTYAILTSMALESFEKMNCNLFLLKNKCVYISGTSKNSGLS